MGMSPHPDWNSIFTARHSGFVLDVPGGNTTAGTRIQQYHFHGGWNQRWRAEPLDAPWFRILADLPGPIVNILCLDVSGGSRSNGAPIQLWPWGGGHNQQWRIEVAPGAGSPWSRLVARHSGSCLDIDGASRDPHARVHQWECHNGQNQQFRWVERAALDC